MFSHAVTLTRMDLNVEMVALPNTCFQHVFGQEVIALKRFHLPPAGAWAVNTDESKSERLPEKVNILSQ
jgi:hypothetical protein